MASIYAEDGDPIPEFLQVIVRALQIGTGVDVYAGEVPDVIPEDEAGFIRPYVVIFSGDGDALPETDLSGRLDLDGLRWDFQTTSVAASAEICSAVAGRVRRVLTNRPLGTYHVLPSPAGFTGVAPVKDTTVKPARYILPRMWRLDTT